MVVFFNLTLWSTRPKTRVTGFNRVNLIFFVYNVVLVKKKIIVLQPGFWPGQSVF